MLIDIQHLISIKCCQSVFFLSLVLLTIVTFTYCNITHIASTEIFKLCVESSHMFHITIIIAEKQNI